MAWTKEYLLKDSSYRDVREGTLGSWAWRKLLKMWPLALDHMRHDVKDGRSTFFRLDNWMGTGRLLDAVGEVGIVTLGVPRSATV